MIKKYEVRTVRVYTKYGRDALTKFWNDPCDTDLIAVFDDLQAAREFYAKIPTSVKYMGRLYGYAHECKFIQPEEYDEDGDVSTESRFYEDWIEADFPDMAEPEEDDDV